MKPILILLTSCLLLTTGCAKNRWLSRRDYSEMQDPFAEEGAAVAEASDSKAPRDRDASRSGKARLNTLDEGTSDTAEPLRGPKPIQRASAARNDATGGVATADYPRETTHDPDAEPVGRSYSEAELSDFINGKSPRSSANPGQSANPMSGNPDVPAAMPRINRTLQPPRLPSLTPEAEGFNSFLNEKTGQATGAMHRASDAAGEVQVEAGDFASWTEQQQASWAGEARRETSNAGAAVGQLKEDALRSAAAIRSAAKSAVPEFDAFSPADEATDDAQPLMKSYDSAHTRPAAVSQDLETNPFDNPFADDPAPATSTRSSAASPPSQRKSATSSGSTASGDGLFSDDTGWKPAHLSRP